eukprot:Gb_33519 [translate_table: standard]
MRVIPTAPAIKKPVLSPDTSPNAQTTLPLFVDDFFLKLKACDLKGNDDEGREAVPPNCCAYIAD